MTHQDQTAIVTGASQGIGAGVVKAFAERGFDVVANSRRISESKEIAGSDKIALVDGDIGDPATRPHSDGSDAREGAPWQNAQFVSPSAS